MNGKKMGSKSKERDVLKKEQVTGNDFYIKNGTGGRTTHVF